MMLSSLPREAFTPSAIHNNWATFYTSNQLRKDEYHTETDSEGAISEKGSEDTPPRKGVSESPRTYCASVDSVSSIQTCAMEPRSVAITSPTVFKCRQLPCRTFISTGSCPYGDRCVFLHCDEITSKPVYIRTKRKSKEDIAGDAFFWPTMSLNSVSSRTDGKNMPHIAQSYIVPVPASCVPVISNNDSAVFSMWEYFLDFCKADALSIVTKPRKVPVCNAYVPVNYYTGKQRLSTLMRLSQGMHA